MTTDTRLLRTNCETKAATARKKFKIWITGVLTVEVVFTVLLLVLM